MMKTGLIIILKDIIDIEPVMLAQLIPKNLMSDLGKLGQMVSKAFVCTLTKAFYFGAICYANEIAKFMNDTDRYLPHDKKLPNPCYWVMAC